MLSVLLGSHPARLPSRALVRLGEILGISDGTVRVALSRMTAEGDLVAAGGAYELSPALLERQRGLDEGRAPAMRPWSGIWEVAVWPAAADGAERAALADVLTRLRLAALRDGVWLRPANLARRWPAAGPSASCTRLDGRPAAGAALAAQLWDLEGWAGRADALVVALDHETTPARRFALAAAAARHLRADPVLPRALVPAAWPGAALRRAYRTYEAELGGLLRTATT